MSINFTEIENFDLAIASVYRAAEIKKQNREMRDSIRKVTTATFLTNALEAI